MHAASEAWRRAEALRVKEQALLRAACGVAGTPRVGKLYCCPYMYTALAQVELTSLERLTVFAGPD
jgi:hypothetical protein